VVCFDERAVGAAILARRRVRNGDRTLLKDPLKSGSATKTNPLNAGQVLSMTVCFYDFK